MGMDYLRSRYGVDFKVGARVGVSGVEPGVVLGTLVGAWNQYFRVRIDGKKRTVRVHPLDCVKNAESNKESGQ